ncbi:hypothetical protein ACJU26_01830 [Acidithiobacillus sp. M4-SHS-6]|uniref:hypothetical protein n=1 Tax=Acidithiobacillus sp. M4-SHS-6 TaxID=3383024 RepID=UPI0039BDD41B
MGWIYLARFLPLLSCAAGPAWAADLPLWPLPDGFSSRPVAERMWLNGVPLRVVFIGGVSREEDFQREMDRSCRQEGGRFRQISLGRKHLWSCMDGPYSQTVRWHLEGGRIMGESSVLNLNAKAKTPAPILALPGQTQVLSELETQDGSLRGRVEALQSSLSPAQIRSFFLREATADDWRLQGALSEKMTRLALEKGRESLDLAFSARPMGGSQTVLIWQKR